MIHENELSLIENRSKSGTPGPWKSYIEGRDHTSGSNFIMTGTDNDFEISGARIEDYDFIANSKQDIPKLLEEIKRLKKIIEEMESKGNVGNVSN